MPRTVYHATLGRLLGYDEDDINFNLNWAEKRRQAEEDNRIERVKKYYNKMPLAFSE